MFRLKMLPIGIENFEKLRTSDFYYVDKTGLIRELLNNWNEVTLFTRPRRFGKSLNMSMLRYFFEPGTDKTLFHGLEIEKETAICEKYMGRFPVISISLKDIEGSSFASAMNMLTHTLQAEARRHSYLLTSNKLNYFDKQELNLLLSGSYSENMMKNSLWTLSNLICRHFEQKVIILIDEYDVPLSKAYDYGYYNEMVLLIRGLFERTLKTNENMQFAVLTGCLRVAKESIFTGLNNLKVCSVTSVRFDEYFGFTDQEVKDLLTYYNLDKRFQTIKRWYDGYLFGDVHVYCPWDVINYIDDLRDHPGTKPKNYWSNTSSNHIIRRFLNKADNTSKWELEQLIAGHTIRKQVFQDLTYAELDKTINHLWSVLFTTGYLTSEPEDLSDDFDDDAYFSHDSSVTETLLLKIPNEEIRSIFKAQIYTWFDDHVKTDTARYWKFSDAFLNGDAITVQNMLNQYLMETISIRDTFIRKSLKENFYHGILLGMLKCREDWIVKSNRESGNGFNDITILYPAGKTAIVIEVKYAEQDNLDAECSNALEQIDTLNYTASLKEHNPVQILKYGIACYKKHCKVALREEFFHH